MRRILLCATLTAAGSASAAVHLPAEGVWQFPASNGSGLTLDVRGATVGIGLYTYDDTGDATWYSGAGALVDGTLDTTVARYTLDAGGAPVQVGETHPLRIDFASATHASVQFDESDPLDANHFAFGAAYTSFTPSGDGSPEMITIPDLRGRWLFAPGGGHGAHDVVFTQWSMSGFESEPFASLASTQQKYSVTCTSTGASPTCDLYLIDIASGNVPPASPLASFEPGDISTTRMASVPDDDGVAHHAFRVPTSRNAPVTGIWQIVGANGQGVTLDVRPDLVAVGVYGYTDDSDATWSLATGALEGNVLEADLTTFAGGACLGCEPAEPVIATDGVRPLRLEFVTPTRALLTIDGAEPLALTLLPFGVAYLDKPIAGDPDGDTFGPFAMPSLLGHWARTDVRENDEDEVERYPAVQFEFTDEEDASIDGGEISHVLAWTDPYPAPELGEDREEATLVLCGDESQEPTDTMCEMQVADGAIALPLPDIDRISTFAPWDAAATRIALTGEVEDEPVFLFRVPAPVATPAE